MLFHDAIEDLNDSDLKTLASFLEGVRLSTKKDQNGKEIEGSKLDFTSMFINMLVFSSSKNKNEKNWNMINEILSKISEENIKILIAFLLGSMHSGKVENRREMIGNLITFIYDVINKRNRNKNEE